ncbi:MAG TPA: hypothetical protein VN461_11195 [Vicinamibacteria bacterium]|jgi:hypothetical protein|nr:hypothetical protein [Vicinamibacteria bacterium]
MMTPRRLSVLMFVLAVLSTISPATADDKALLRLRAFAVDMSGLSRPRAGTIDIVIERWSTDEEREQLRSALIEKGSDALLTALQKIKPRAGYISSSNRLGWDVRYARLEPFGDGGRRVIIATDRPMSFWELRNQPRSVDYEFTLAELRLTKDGKGVGKLVTAAKITYNKDTRSVEIENYGIEPVRLSEVEVVGGKEGKEK